MNRTLPPGLEDLVEQQDGAVSRAQCLRHGCTTTQLEWRCTSESWQRVHPGVYVTHSGPVDWRTKAAAAILFCGEGATLAYESAARVLGMRDTDPSQVHVQVPHPRQVRAPKDVVVRTVRHLDDRRAPVAAWPPRTSVPDTVLDLAERDNATAAEALVAKACQRRLTTVDRLAAALRLRRRYCWRDLLTVAFEDVADGLESVLEIRYVRGVERPHGLPEATRQLRRVGGGRRRRDDNAYEDHRVLVEVDGQLGHRGAGTLDDRMRDNSSSAEGWVTVRLGWSQVSYQSCESARDIALTLRRRGWQGTPCCCGPDCRIGDVAVAA